MGRRRKKPDDGVHGMGTLIDILMDRYIKELESKGYKRLDYHVNGRWMWRCPDGSYKMEDKLLDELEEKGGGESKHA